MPARFSKKVRRSFWKVDHGHIGEEERTDIARGRRASASTSFRRPAPHVGGPDGSRHMRPVRMVAASLSNKSSERKLMEEPRSRPRLYFLFSILLGTWMRPFARYDHLCLHAIELQAAGLADGEFVVGEIDEHVVVAQHGGGNVDLGGHAGSHAAAAVGRDFSWINSCFGLRPPERNLHFADCDLQPAVALSITLSSQVTTSPISVGQRGATSRDRDCRCRPSRGRASWSRREAARSTSMTTRL